jgi:hypothetical protein
MTTRTSHVLGMSHRFQMDRINASSVTTEVVNIQYAINRTNEFDIEHPVGKSRPVYHLRSFAVPVGHQGTDPVPATGVWVDDELSQVVYRRRYKSIRSSSASEPLPVLTAHTLTETLIPVRAVTADDTAIHEPDDTQGGR